MKVSFIALLLATLVSAKWAFGTDRLYDKWHETDLERWLSDHDIPYPAASDRKDLVDLVGKNWEQTEAASENAYANVKGWIFDTWSESALKSFLDRHGIPNPQPRTRDSLLATARENYQTVADKLGESSAYPGNWLYEAWSDSELKAWLDTHGIPVPQTSERNRLIALARRNAYKAGLSAEDSAKVANQRAKEAGQKAFTAASDTAESISEAVFAKWSDSELKKWLDERGIPIPQGSHRNELLALLRRNKHRVRAGTLDPSKTAASAYGAATSNAGNQYARASSAAQEYGEQAFENALNTWSESRLKAFLDARGVPVPQPSTRENLLAQARLQRHKAATGWSAWTFDTWTRENLQKFLESRGHKSAAIANAKRQQLVKSAQNEYAKASSSGSDQLASLTSSLAQATATAKNNAFDSWSDSDLKAYLDTYGVPLPQGSKRNDMLAYARRNANLFTHGANVGIYERLRLGVDQLYDTIQNGLNQLWGIAGHMGERAGDAAKEKATEGKHRAYEAGQRATDRVKEEL